jgi:DNA-binding FadR family transcriptional regulator
MQRKGDPVFSKIEAVPAYRVVCDAIEARILDGGMKAGDQLPTESELAEQFGLARHTVREGLRLLEESGFVAREAGRRLFVKMPRYAELAPRATRALVMQRVTFRELWEVSLALEPQAALGAARRITPEDLQELVALQFDMEARRAKGLSITALDVVFHTRIAEIAGNKALLLAREPISALFFPALEKLFHHPRTAQVAPDRLIAAHRGIIEALRASNAGQAEQWMRRHMEDFRRGFEVCGFDLDQALTGLPASFDSRMR